VKAWLIGDEVTLDQNGTGTFRIDVEVPPDHHGYLDPGDDGLLIPFAFTFAPLEEPSGRVTELTRPPGKRDDDVHATVLRGAGAFTFRLDTNGATWAGDGEMPATLHYQICNDITNICYPPRTTEIPLKVVAASSVESRAAAAQPQPAPSSGASLTISERITDLFRRSMGNLMLALILVVVAGLLTAATPCVYAVIPVTAALLAARGGGSRRRSRWHTIVYCLGMMSFYSLLGLVAATTGTALSAVMTSAWVNLGFAGLFVYLGLSMLGFYELPVLPALTAKLDTTVSRQGGFSGTFLMGITAGLVVSPCVGPVAGAILLEITGQAAQGSGAAAGIAVSTLARGIILMTGFGLGLSLVFLLVGLLSNRLPQSGKWLTRVKIVLGLPILYFAYAYYLKGMETAGVADNVAHAMLLGVVAIAVAVLIGAFHPLGEPPQRPMLLRRAGGIILLIVGVHFLYNGLGHSGILIRVSPTVLEAGVATAIATSLSGPSGRAQHPQIQVQGNLSWFRDFAVAKQHAEVVRQPIFVDFYATWCANCKEFERLALRHSQLNTALQQAVLVKIYDTDPIFPTFQQDPHFPELGGVGGQPFLPLFAIYTPQGQFVWKGQDYRAVRTMIAQLERARAGKL
jgi:thiol:disulfide interchange protein DsbD